MTEFKQRCECLGIKGIALHCYRYGRAGRGGGVGFPEHHTQTNLGYPTLSHPRLAHDPIAIGRLKTILSQTSGTTWLHATREELVTFAIMALGHSYHNIDPRQHPICGLDAHRPDWYVEVPGLHCLNSIQRPERIRAEIASHWTRIQKTKTGLVIFNGVWPQMTAQHDEVAKLARHTHVLIGTQTASTKSSHPINVTGPAHVIAVAADRTHSDKILLEIQAV